METNCLLCSFGFFYFIGKKNMALEKSGSSYEDVDKVAYVGNLDVQLSEIFSGFYETQMELFNLEIGKIFSTEDLRKLKKENRPRFPINLFLPSVEGILGNFESNYPKVDYIPQTKDDEQRVNLVEQVDQFILNVANNTNYEVGRAFLNAIIAKIGWVKQTHSYDKDPNGMIEIASYSPFRIAFDLENFRRDLSKTKFIRDAGWYTPEELIQTYASNLPDLEEEIRSKSLDLFGESTFSKKKREITTWMERVLNLVKDYSSGEKGYNDHNIKFDKHAEFIDLKTSRIKAIDFFERRLVRQMDLIDFRTNTTIPITEMVQRSKKAIEVNGGDKKWYDNAKLQMIRQAYPNSGIKEYFDEKIYQTSVIPGLFLKPFEGEQDIQSKRFNFTPILSVDHHPDPMELSSVVEQIASPVKKYNLQENTLMTYIMRQTHASWTMTDSMYKTHGQYFMANQIGGVIRHPDGTQEGKDFNRVDPPQSNAAIDRMSENSKEEIKILGHSRDAAQGAQETTGESGKLVALRIQQNNLGLEPMAKNAQFAYLMISKNNIAYMKKYMTDPRTIRIVKDDNDPEWMQLNYPVMGQIQNDLSKIDFDVQIATSPYGKQAAEVQEQKVFNMANFIADKFGPDLVPLEQVLEDSTLQHKGKWITHVENVRQQQAQMAQQQQALQEKDQQYLDQDRALELQSKANQVVTDELAKKSIGMK